MDSFIVVKGNGRTVKVTAESNGTVSEDTLRGAFQLEQDVPIGLYRNEIALKRRYEAIDYVFELQSGWIEAEFELNWDEARRPCPGTNQALDNRQNPYYPALPPDPAPTADAFRKWMFFLNENAGKSCTICVHPRFFVTVRYGTHLKFKVGDTVKMYRAEKEVDEQVGIEVFVVKINELLDFILLKSKSDVVERGPPIAGAQESEPFTLAGFGNDARSLSFFPGAIHSCRSYFYSRGDQQLGPFILGTSQSSNSDTGAGIWGSSGLIGMNYGCTTMPPHPHYKAISEAAIFNAKNIICLALWFKDAYMEELEKERTQEEVTSPPQKKACLTTDVACSPELQIEKDL